MSNQAVCRMVFSGSHALHRNEISKCFFSGNCFFLILLLAFSLHGFADADCNSQNCDNVDNYWVKIKRLTDIDLGSWTGNDVASGKSQLVNKKTFCAISYREDGNNRVMYNPELQLQGPADGNAGQFIVSNDGNQIPLTIHLERYSGNDAPQTPDRQSFTPGYPVKLTGNNAYSLCRENELSVTVTAYKDDIISAGATGIYSGIFKMQVGPGTSPESPGPVFIEFSITLNVAPAILISGLKDMQLTSNIGQDISKSQKFCVYAASRSKFKIKGLSRFGSGAFQLDNNGQTMEYNLTVGPSNNNGNGNKITLVESDDFVGHPSWKGDQQLNCGNDENMMLTVSISKASLDNATSGLYQDTVTLTVTPE